jgi:osmotically-inducible protein OsmY
VSESAPLQAGIPAAPPALAPPAPVVTPPPDQTSLTLTPAAGAGSARSGSAALVATPGAPSDPARDKGDSAQDQESIREIRQLLASDKSLAALAPHVTIVARSGRVWLRGQVSTNEQRAGLEKLARKAGNVVNVNNELVVME